MKKPMACLLDTPKVLYVVIAKYRKCLSIDGSIPSKIVRMLK